MTRLSTAKPAPSLPLTLWVSVMSGAVLCGLWLGFLAMVGWPV